jgi:hypothetical protein
MLSHETLQKALAESSEGAAQPQESNA